MRIVNRIVNILVLIFAVAAAVFSYLLFEKREKMVSGWEKMANTISQSAKALDEKSGTKLSSELSASSLNHKNFNKTDLSALDKALPKLPDGSKKVVAQRDSLAETLYRVARKSEVKGVAAADLKKLSSSQSKQKFIESEIDRSIQRSNEIFQNYVKHSESVGAGLSVREIKESPDAAFRSFQNAIDAVKQHSRAGDDTISAIGRDVGVYPNLRASNYKGEMRKVRDGVKKLKSTISSIRRELDQERRRSRTLAGSLNTSNSNLKTSKEVLAEREKQIADLRNKLYGSMQPPTDAELYATVQGRVESVNTRWKFIVINLGAQMPTIKKSKTEERMFMIPLMKGFIMTIARNIDTTKPEYIGKIIVTQVGNNYAVANIDVNSLQSEVKVGDAVYFTEDDTISNLKFRESIRNKK